MSNFHIQRLVHFYTRFRSFSILNRGPTTLLRLERCRTAASRAPASLGVCATRRPRPHAGRGVPLPHAPHPEAPWSPRGPRASRHAVSAQGSPQTAGLSAAPHCTCAGRGGRATAVCPSSRRRHRGGFTYKNRAPPPPRTDTAASSCHPRRLLRPFPPQPMFPTPGLGPIGAQGLACCPAAAELRRASGRRGRCRLQPPRAVAAGLPTANSGSSQTWVSRSPSPSYFPAEPGGTSPEFRLTRRHPWPRIQLLNPFSFQGLKCKVRAWL
jgi:hypothetical protein